MGDRQLDLFDPSSGAPADAIQPVVANPGVRAAAARCVRAWPRCAPALKDLPQDLHEDVGLAAACVLGRLRIEGVRPRLLSALRVRPSPEIVEAIAGIVDEEVLVLLGRMAETRPELAGPVREALEGSDHPRAATIAARIGSATGRP